VTSERPGYGTAAANARAWLADGPVQLPDGVLDAVLEEIHVTPQRRGGLASRLRFVPMRLDSRIGGVAVVVVVAVAIGVLVLLRQPAGVAAPAATPVGSAAPPSAGSSPSAGPSPTASASPVASVAVTSPTPGGGLGTGPLEAGTYASSVFSPTITLTLPAGWTRRVDDGELLWLSKGSTDLAFHFMAAEVSPDGVAKAMGIAKGASALPVPPQAVTFGSAAGFSAERPGVGTGIETVFFKPGLNPYDMARGTRLKAWVLDGGRPVTVSLVAPEAQYDSAVAEVEKILVTLKFGQ